MSNHKRPFPEAEKPKLKQSQSLPMGYCTVYLDQMELPQGDLHPYTRIEFGCDATAVVAITCQNRWIINWEYRYPTKEWLLSIAGGKIDEGEDAVKAAQRELLEETGYLAHEFVFLGSLYLCPSFSSQKIHFVLAKEAIFHQPPSLEPLERFQTLLMTEEELQDEIRKGAPVDGILCTALYLKHLLKE